MLLLLTRSDGKEANRIKNPAGVNLIYSVYILLLKFQDYKLLFIDSLCYNVIYIFFSVIEILSFNKSLDINSI